MHLFHLYHRGQFDKFVHSKFWQFELSIWLHVFARSMIDVFVPVILLQTGFSLTQVMFYYLCFMIANLPLNFVSAKLTRKIGGKLVMILSTVAVISFFLFLNNIQIAASLTPLIILGLLAALYDALYYVSHIYLFLESEEKESDQNKDVSILYIIRQIAILLGPAAGGLIFIFANQNALISTSVFFFILSMIPLFYIKGMPDKPTRSPMKIKEFLAHPREKRNYFSISLFGIHANAEAVLWPLFIYTVFQSIESVAYVPIIVSITAMIFTYSIGKLTKKGTTELIMLGSTLVGIMWFLRMINQNPTFYYISIVFVGLFSLLISLPLDSDLMRRGRQIDSLTAALYRNVFSMTPRILLYAILIIVLEVFKVSFIAAAISLFFLILLNTIFMIYRKKTAQT